MGEPLLAITLHRPWPWCIFWGSRSFDGSVNEGDADYTKPVENRSWKPPSKLIGRRIAIHAGKKLDRKVDAYLAANVYAIRLPARSRDEGIVGTARVCGVVVGDRESEAAPWRLRLIAGEWGKVGPLSAAAWFIGPYGWLLDQRVALRNPVACKGAQGLWRVPDEIAAVVAIEAVRASALA